MQTNTESTKILKTRKKSKTPSVRLDLNHRCIYFVLLFAWKFHHRIHFDWHIDHAFILFDTEMRSFWKLICLWELDFRTSGTKDLFKHMKSMARSLECANPNRCGKGVSDFVIGSFNRTIGSFVGISCNLPTQMNNIAIQYVHIS